MPVLNAPPAAPGVALAPAIVKGVVSKAALPPTVGARMGVSAGAKPGVGLDDAALPPKLNVAPVVAVLRALLVETDYQYQIIPWMGRASLRKQSRGQRT